MDIWEVFNLEEHEINGTECWVIDHRRQGDARFTRTVFPKATLEWRAAEYDMDGSTPEGRAEILDLIMHEFYMPPIMQPPVPTGKGRMFSGATQKQEVHLYNAATKAEAREAHLERVAKVKREVAHIQWPEPAKKASALSEAAPSMLDDIISRELDPKSIRDKKAFVHKQRQKRGLEPITEEVNSRRPVPNESTVLQSEAIARDNGNSVKP